MIKTTRCLKLVVYLLTKTHTSHSNKQDGSKSIYCTNCYKDGKFIAPNLFMEEMIFELLIQFWERQWARKKQEKEMTTLLPRTLKRWK